jgi:hypothetical protein
VARCSYLPAPPPERVLDVYWIQQFWFDDFLETNGDLKHAYLTIDGFGTRNVVVSTHLNVVAPGAHIVDDGNAITGDLGSAAVGIKWYEYVDDSGLHHVDNSYFVPHARIHNCVGVQISFAYRRVWAGAAGSVTYFND